ncbi:MAG: heme o synthase [Burkholderia sp.]|nr:heme o synthase [Burkholderia sp.]
MAIFLNPYCKHLSQYLTLTKPRVTQLVVFCSVIGMFLATPQGEVQWKVLIGGTIGIWMLAGAAFAINCMIEQKVDALMQRTESRPSARGEIKPEKVLALSTAIGTIGACVLYTFTNPLTMWLTIATFIGYAVIYTMFLKSATPQNIVIGGISGAMPPAIGWAAATGDVTSDAWILVLIIFIWTPPHFWLLALYRYKDYENSGLPMLPVTHGKQYTRLHILLYSIVLFAVSLMPFVSNMSGIIYFLSAIVLSTIFISYTWKIYHNYSDKLARRAFRFSIAYLSLLFFMMLVDHYTRSRF